jgi:FixJ family two-component response regulator
MTASSPSAGPLPRVFVVDDDLSAYRGLVRLLASAGYRVKPFASPQDFLDSPDRPSCDCLILDVRMPGMSGLDLQQRLIAAGWPPPIIFLTAHDDEEERTLALERGALAYLLKPADERSLLAAISRALERTQNERQGRDGE